MQAAARHNALGGRRSDKEMITKRRLSSKPCETHLNVNNDSGNFFNANLVVLSAHSIYLSPSCICFLFIFIFPAYSFERIPPQSALENVWVY